MVELRALGEGHCCGVGGRGGQSGVRMGQWISDATEIDGVDIEVDE